MALRIRASAAGIKPLRSSGAGRSQAGSERVRSRAMRRSVDNLSIPPAFTVLGIETSCDDPDAAVVSGRGEIRAILVLHQLDEHSPYGGVVPEIAARASPAHLARLTVDDMTHEEMASEEPGTLEEGS